MIAPTWSEWFVRNEVEGAEPSGLSIWYLGCNGFVLRTAETTVYLDPYFGRGEHRRSAVRMCPVPMDPADATECDAVLATHEHVDHLHPPSYGPLLDLGADLYAPEGALAQPSYDGELGIPGTQRRPVSKRMSFEVGELSIAVRGANDPDSVHPVSYVVEHDGRIFFHGGDSRPCEAFADVGATFDVDLGALAYGSTGMIRFDGATDAERKKWYMDEDEVVAAANQLQLDRLLPTHWNMWKGMEADPTAVQSHAGSFRYPAVIEVGRTGDRFTLDDPGVVPRSYIE